MVSDFIRDGAWDYPKLHLLQYQAGIPQHIISKILETPILEGEQDTPRWTLSQRGDFTLASTWSTLRSHRPIIPGLEDIWKAGLTTSIVIFIWRLLSNRIPVDTKLQWRRIEMASKCQCCTHSPRIESLQLLFIQGYGARSIWREFDGWFEGSSPPISINDTIPERIDVWALRTQHQNKGHLCRAVPLLILWFIWAERNRSRHEQVQFKPFNVVWQVQMFIHKGMANGTIKSKHWRGMQIRLRVPSQTETNRPRPLAMIIKWHPPEPPWIKINTDGAFVKETHKAGGGGIIRDEGWNILAAFATPLDANSALEAELLAILQGITVAKDFGRLMWIESDAEQAINLVNSAAWGPAHIRHVRTRIAILKRQHNFRATFIHREGNNAADLLAKLGLEQPTFQRMSAESAPATSLGTNGQNGNPQHPG